MSSLSRPLGLHMASISSSITTWNGLQTQTRELSPRGEEEMKCVRMKVREQEEREYVHAEDRIKQER